MKQKTVQFFYQKVNGEIRQAFGTLRDEVINTIVKKTGRKPNDNMFIYFDTEKQEFRSTKEIQFNQDRIINPVGVSVKQTPSTTNKIILQSWNLKI